MPLVWFGDENFYPQSEINTNSTEQTRKPAVARKLRDVICFCLHPM